MENPSENLIVEQVRVPTDFLGGRPPEGEIHMSPQPNVVHMDLQAAQSETTLNSRVNATTCTDFVSTEALGSDAPMDAAFGQA
ncbi:hypothetical protein V6N13_148333 [Hibiscus sabdariffa]|uniref:Uncharacterized protein n=1 Tax=Hibiscus sabdariffa TaxID=183260 RepID=A0ABR2TYS6_9ROSI